jgi:23S rRNA pseudouridine2605 synthase
VLEFTLREGRNRQIRRMCEALNLEVMRLKRTQMGPLKLGMLPVGQARELTAEELKRLREAVKI